MFALRVWAEERWMNEKSKLDEQIVAWCRSADSQSLSHSVSLSLTLETGSSMHKAEQLKMAAASLLPPSDARLRSLIPRGTDVVVTGNHL